MRRFCPPPDEKHMVVIIWRGTFLLVNTRLDRVYSARHPAVNWATITIIFIFIIFIKVIRILTHQSHISQVSSLLSKTSPSYHAHSLLTKTTFTKRWWLSCDRNSSWWDGEHQGGEFSWLQIFLLLSKFDLDSSIWSVIFLCDLQFSGLIIFSHW